MSDLTKWVRDNPELFGGKPQKKASRLFSKLFSATRNAVTGKSTVAGWTVPVVCGVSGYLGFCVLGVFFGLLLIVPAYFIGSNPGANDEPIGVTEIEV